MFFGFNAETYCYLLRYIDLRRDGLIKVITPKDRDFPFALEHARSYTDGEDKDDADFRNQEFIVGSLGEELIRHTNWGVPVVRISEAAFLYSSLMFDEADELVEANHLPLSLLAAWAVRDGRTVEGLFDHILDKAVASDSDVILRMILDLVWTHNDALLERLDRHVREVTDGNPHSHPAFVKHKDCADRLLTEVIVHGETGTLRLVWPFLHDKVEPSFIHVAKSINARDPDMTSLLRTGTLGVVFPTHEIVDKVEKKARPPQRRPRAQCSICCMADSVTRSDPPACMLCKCPIRRDVCRVCLHWWSRLHTDFVESKMFCRACATDRFVDRTDDPLASAKELTDSKLAAYRALRRRDDSFMAAVRIRTAKPRR